MKTYILLLTLILPFLSKAQSDKYASSYVCNNGGAHFISIAPFENIEAFTHHSYCVINAQSKTVAVKIPIQSFRFESKLMQDHFNDMFLESDKYPTANLEASIVENIDLTKDGVYDVTLKGTLEIHGVKHERELKGKITVRAGQVANAVSYFDIKLDDYNLTVPLALSMNIAEKISIDVNFNFEKFSNAVFAADELN